MVLNKKMFLYQYFTRMNQPLLLNFAFMSYTTQESLLPSKSCHPMHIFLTKGLHGPANVNQNLGIEAGWKDFCPCNFFQLCLETKDRKPLFITFKWIYSVGNNPSELFLYVHWRLESMSGCLGFHRETRHSRHLAAYELLPLSERIKFLPVS